MNKRIAYDDFICLSDASNVQPGDQVYVVSNDDGATVEVEAATVVSTEDRWVRLAQPGKREQDVEYWHVGGVDW